MFEPENPTKGRLVGLERGWGEFMGRINHADAFQTQEFEVVGVADKFAVEIRADGAGFTDKTGKSCRGRVRETFSRGVSSCERGAHTDAAGVIGDATRLKGVPVDDKGTIGEEAGDAVVAAPMDRTITARAQMPRPRGAVGHSGEGQVGPLAGP